MLQYPYSVTPDDRYAGDGYNASLSCAGRAVGRVRSTADATILADLLNGQPRASHLCWFLDKRTRTHAARAGPDATITAATAPDDAARSYPVALQINNRSIACFRDHRLARRLARWIHAAALIRQRTGGPTQTRLNRIVQHVT